MIATNCLKSASRTSLHAELWKTGFLSGRSAIVTAEDVNAANTGGFYYPLNVERELITAVIRAHGEKQTEL